MNAATLETFIFQLHRQIDRLFHQVNTHRQRLVENGHDNLRRQEGQVDAPGDVALVGAANRMPISATTLEGTRLGLIGTACSTLPPLTAAL